MILTWKDEPYYSAFMMLEDAVMLLEEESSHGSCPAVNTMSYKQ